MMPKHELHTDSTNKDEYYYQIIMNPKNWKYLKNINDEVIKEFENIGIYYTDDFYKNESFEELEKQIKDKQDNIKKTFLISSSTVRAYVGDIKSLIYIIKAVFNEGFNFNLENFYEFFLNYIDFIKYFNNINLSSQQNFLKYTFEQYKTKNKDINELLNQLNYYHKATTCKYKFVRVLCQKLYNRRYVEYLLNKLKKEDLNKYLNYVIVKYNIQNNPVMINFN